jgi:hypothetical protein
MAGSNGNYANQAALVSTDWVAEHGSDPNVRLIEVEVPEAAAVGARRAALLVPV